MDESHYLYLNPDNLCFSPVGDETQVFYDDVNRQVIQLFFTSNF